MYIRKLRYPWRHLKVKTPARIGLSPPFVKFGLVRPDQSNFVETVPKFDRKTLENGDSFLKHVQLYHNIRKTQNTKDRYRVPVPSTYTEHRVRVQSTE
jgi:hypothetical protein